MKQIQNDEGVLNCLSKDNLMKLLMYKILIIKHQKKVKKNVFYDDSMRNV